MHGGIISGGVQGVCIQAGATLNASDVKLKDFSVTGYETADQSSLLKLSYCLLKGHLHSPHGPDDVDSVGVGEVVSGIEVFDGVSATLSECTVSGTVRHSASFLEGASGRVVDCTLTPSLHDGLYVAGHGSNVVLDWCTLSGNAESGLFVCQEASVTAASCESSLNYVSGYTVQSKAELPLKACKSTGDALE